MKKLLIVGAGIEQVPAIKIARAMGIYVITTDLSSAAPGFSFADKSYIVSTNDYEGNLNVAKNENIDGIMTLCSETAIPIIAKVASTLKLPGITELTAFSATNKGKMRELARQFDIPVAPYIMTDNLNDALGFVNSHNGPWVIKPSDSSGQRGTTFTYNPEEVETAFFFAKKYANDNLVLLDQFVEGPEINVTALVNNSEITYLSLSNRVTLGAPNFGIAVHHITPVHLNSKKQEKIKELSTKTIRAIEMKNGIAYPQFIMSEKGPYLMEIAARIPGGHMREVAMYNSGIDMIKTSIWQALGYDLNKINIKTEEKYNSVSIFFITSKNIPQGVSKVDSLSGIEEVKKQEGVIDCYFRLEPGQEIPKLESSVGRFGAILIVGKSKNETLSLTEKAFNTIKINGKNLISYDNITKYNHNVIKLQRHE